MLLLLTKPAIFFYKTEEESNRGWERERLAGDVGDLELSAIIAVAAE